MSIWATNGGIYMGVATDRTEGTPPKFANPMPYVGDRHIICIGPNGSGKSRRLLLPNLHRLTGWSQLVIDPKGELTAMSQKHREDAGGTSIVINPFNVLSLGDSGLNPVASLDPDDDDFPDDALGLAEALIRVEGKEPHWSQAAQEIVAGLIMYSRLSEENGGSLVHVRSLLGLPLLLLRKEIANALETALRWGCEEIANKLARFLDAEPDNKEVSGVISTALTQTRWLDSRPVKRSLQKDSRIDFSVMKERPTTVYLVLPANRLGTHATWLRLMITCVLQPLMKDTRKSKVPVLFMLDEFAQLGHLPVIENNMAMMRGYHLKLMCVLQDAAQAEAIYEKRWQSFVSNSGVLQAFSPQDIQTAEFLSRLSGETLRELRGRSSSRQPGSFLSGKSTSSSETPLPLMLPQDLRNMDPGYSVVFSHKTKGPVRVFFPDPSEIPGVAGLAALSPEVGAGPLRAPALPSGVRLLGRPR